jgi:hypothetical protein
MWLTLVSTSAFSQMLVGFFKYIFLIEEVGLQLLEMGRENNFQ